jgi:putative peptidoglycan lipid II flippase
VLVLMGPGTIGLAATQLNVFVNTVVATGEGTGAVSWLGYAFRVMYLPIGLFGVSIATATTPAMSRLAATRDTARMRSTLASAVALMLTLNVPATLGLIALAAPIVRLLFERGSFTPADTAATAAAVQFYAVGLVGYSVVKIVSPTFYALGRSRTPVTVGIGAVLLNAVLSVTSAPVFGYRALALSASIAALLNAGVLAWLARGVLGGLELTRLAITFGKTLAAGCLMAFTSWGMVGWLETAAPGQGLLLQIARLLAAIAAGVLVLALSAQALRIREFEEVRDAVLGRLRRLRARAD